MNQMFLTAFLQVGLALPRYGLGLTLNVTEWPWCRGSMPSPC